MLARYLVSLLAAAVALLVAGPVHADIPPDSDGPYEPRPEPEPEPVESPEPEPIAAEDPPLVQPTESAQKGGCSIAGPTGGAFALVGLAVAATWRRRRG